MERVGRRHGAADVGAGPRRPRRPRRPLLHRQPPLRGRPLRPRERAHPRKKGSSFLLLIIIFFHLLLLLLLLLFGYCCCCCCCLLAAGKPFHRIVALLLSVFCLRSDIFAVIFVQTFLTGFSFKNKLDVLLAVVVVVVDVVAVVFDIFPRFFSLLSTFTTELLNRLHFFGLSKKQLPPFYRPLQLFPK